MSANINDLEKSVNSALTTAIKTSKVNFNQLYIEIDLDNLYSTILYLKTNNKCKFRQLIDITAVDYPNKEKRFNVVYFLLSHENNSRAVINVNINEKMTVPSIIKIYPSANWMEREVFDMYGIAFKDHPNLKRILTDYEFQGHPLRKDFPLTGHTEVRYSENKKKVINEPVKLEQAYRNFDFDSPWEGTKYIKKTSKEK
mgnify:CR=1 FL=1